MPLTTGQILNNRYRIAKLLGQGGFGAVYRAWDLNLEKNCAIKENLINSPEAQRQFRREARILSDLSHPHLPRVSDHFSIPGISQYLVMDYVDGWDLAAVLEQTGRPLSLSKVLPWIDQVCDALDFLHTRTTPVIHRDIKPANIKITPQAQAMLVDFGIAKLYDSNEQTTVGARAVTPGYSPIEQYGRGGHTDARSDIYSLGATMYALLTATEPLEATDRNLGKVLPELHALNPSISPRLEALILKSMSLRPEDRFQSMADFRAALRPILMAQSSPTLNISAPGAAPGPAPVIPAYRPKPVQSAGTMIIPGTVPNPNGFAQSPAPKKSTLPGAAHLRAKKSPDSIWLWVLGISIIAFLVLAGIYLWTMSQKKWAAPAAEPVFVVRGTATVSQLPTITPIESSMEYPMVSIPEGEFTMGIDPQAALAECQNLATTSCDPGWYEHESPPHQVYLDEFMIDVYEVTNARYAVCVEAGDCAYPGMGRSMTRSNYFGQPEYDEYPMLFATWEMAQSYCEWRGGRLPTEAEWEKAARGGLEGAMYPWGNDRPDCSRANFRARQICTGDTSPVGSYAPNGYGLYDMAGNVWEWVQDFYLADFYKNSPFENPIAPDTGEAHVVRGGSWNNEEIYMRNSVRYYTNSTQTLSLLGFRCTVTP